MPETQNGVAPPKPASDASAHALNDAELIKTIALMEKQLAELKRSQKKSKEEIEGTHEPEQGEAVVASTRPSSQENNNTAITSDEVLEEDQNSVTGLLGTSDSNGGSDTQ